MKTRAIILKAGLAIVILGWLGIAYSQPRITMASPAFKIIALVFIFPSQIS